MDMWQASMARETGIGRIVTGGYEAESKIAEGAVGFGKALMIGTDPSRQVKVFSGGAVYGIALDNGFGDRKELKFADKSAIPVIRKGIVWVKVLEAVTAGDTPKVDNATGDFRPSGTEEVGVTVLNSAQFKTSALANGLAALEINLP